MKKLNALLAITLLMTLLIACSSDDENNQKSDDNNAVTNGDNSENNNTENNTDNNGKNNDGNSGTSENDDNNGKFSDGEALSLGETGTVESTIGEYEVTFESFELQDKMEGEESVKNNGIFVLMDATVEITGDEPIEASDINKARLFNAEEASTENTSYYESVNMIEGTLEPGDKVDGQFLFSLAESDAYKLVLNYGLDGVATEITWEFSADEASN